MRIDRLRPLLFTLLLFAFFHFRNPYLKPVLVTLHVPEGEFHELVLQWDSGYGFNSIEEERVTPARAGTYNYSIPGAVRALKVMQTPPTYAFDLSVPHRNTDPIIINDADRVQFHAPLLVIQLLFAALLAYGASYLMPQLAIMSRAFWCVFAFCICASLIWWLAWWPAAMTYLSLFNWVKTKTLAIDYMSPWYYQVWLVAISQLAASPAVVVLTQILLNAIVLAATLAWTIRAGGSKAFAALSIFVYFVSPLGAAWSAMLWFDIPYAALVAAAASAIFWLYFNKRYLGGEYRPSPQTLLVSVFLFVSLALMRRNGIVFLALIPALLYIFRLIPRKECLYFTTLSLISYGLLEYGVTRALHVDEHTSTIVPPRFVSEVQWKINPLHALLLNPSGYVSDDYQRDRHIIEKLLPLESVQRWYRPGTIEGTFWKLSRDIASEDIDAINSLYYRLIPLNVSFFLRERLFAILNNLNNFIFYTALPQNGKRTRSMPPGSTFLRGEPIFPGMQSLLERYVGFLQHHQLGHFFLLTPFVGLILLAWALLLYRRFPATALFSAVVLFQVPFLFLVLPGAESRYFSFIFIGSLFVLPFAELERRKNHSG